MKRTVVGSIGSCILAAVMAVLIADRVPAFGRSLPIGIASNAEASLRQAMAQQVAPRPTGIYRSMFETVAPSAPFDLVVQVREFVPGAWSGAHTHPAPTFITILEGQITNIQIVDGQKAEPVIYGPGDTFVELAWEGHEVGNDGAVRARWLQARLVPKDVPAAINLPFASSRPGAPNGTVPYTASAEVTNVSGAIDVYQAWQEWAPGDRIPPHFHPGPELALITDGELTSIKSSMTTATAGQSIANLPGEIHATANMGTEQATVATTHLIASGRPLTFQAE